MSERDQLIQARELIQQKRYSEARAILQSLDHPKAREWLAKLDQMDDDLDFPEPEGVKGKRRKKEAVRVKGGGPGVLKIGLGVGCVGPLALCIGLIVIVVIVAALIQAGEEAATEEAVERNNGRGTLDEPIAAGNWMDFEDGDVRVTRIVRPANEEVEEMNFLNDDPTSGTEYVLVWFEMKCGEDKCNPPIDTDLHLMDSDGTAWKEPLFIALDDDLDHEEAIRGGTMAGWQAFEFPTREPIRTIRVKWGSETLHVEPPAA
jgi:hypothetical protein